MQNTDYTGSLIHKTKNFLENPSHFWKRKKKFQSKADEQDGRVSLRSLMVTLKLTAMGTARPMQEQKLGELSWDQGHGAGCILRVHRMGLGACDNQDPQEFLTLQRTLVRI